MTADPRADTWVRILPDRGALYLAAPKNGAQAALYDALCRAGLSVIEVQPGVLTVPFAARRLEMWQSVFSGVFNHAELNATKCLLVADTSSASGAELMQAESLSDFLGWLEGQWLRSVLESHRLLSVFQPIVHVQRPKHVYAYECLLRGRTPNGQFIMPDRLFAAARSTGLLEKLDSDVRVTALESAAKEHISTPIFVNIYPNSIQHPQQFLETTIEATEATGLSPNRFVFEFVEREEIADASAFLKILDAFRREGFRVALDDVGAGYSSLNVLVRVKPDFMKLDMGLIRNVDSDAYKARVAAKLLELARELRVKTVVEGIETVGEWRWSRDHGADYAQGYLFARPETPPPPSRFHGADEVDTALAADSGSAESWQAATYVP